ncbi:MAG: hypothetical protein ACREX4_17865 [Gammaproteobacteria bacterium]
MSGVLVCWRCGASLEELLLPFKRIEQCPRCQADLHVCRMCGFYRPSLSSACDEPMAEHVPEKERANFCDYFKPRPHAYSRGHDARSKTAIELYSLFGMTRREAEADKDVGAKAEEARKQLEELFGTSDSKDAS